MTKRSGLLESRSRKRDKIVPVFSIVALVAGLAAIVACSKPKDAIVMCMYNSMPSAVIEDIDTVRYEAGAIVGKNKNGDRFAYHMIPTEICYITTKEVR